MTDVADLFLHEQVLLLALHDEKGTISDSMFAYAVAGAMVSELLLRGALRVEQVKKKKMLAIGDPRPVGVRVLDECLDRVRSAKRRADVATWIGRLANMKNLKHRVAERLYLMGVLRKEEGRVLWVFPRVVYPTANPGPEQRLVDELRTAVAEDGEVDPRIAILVALTRSSGILGNVVGKKLLKSRKARVEALASMHDVGG
ncbi:MAG: GOLPH3/VPS74 family protein, partial [Longimicrobiales bacterium]